MTPRELAAYVLIVLVMGALGSVYLYLTRERRAFGRADRAFRRAKRAADKTV